MPLGRGDAYCSECTAARRAERAASRDWSREYETRREREDPKYRSFYRSKDWRLTSEKYRVDRGHRCERCGDVATDVHHVLPIQIPEGWAMRLDPENLMLLCVRCHNEIHGRTFGGERRGPKADSDFSEGAVGPRPHLHRRAGGRP